MEAYIFMLLVLLVCIATIKEVSTANMLRKYPLDEPVEMKIDRELMNKQYEFLSEEEKEILYFTSDLNFSIYLTRKITNKLVITVKKDNGETKDWTVYQSVKTSDKWIKYLKNEFFTKKKRLNKIWKYIWKHTSKK